jgi:predicted dehydrogenase
MCGISGLANWGNRETLARMTAVQRHRGPNDSGLWDHRSPDGSYIGLGSRRLSILDLSADGHMPMPNEDSSVWITYNGEIYNARTLRRELEAKGHQFRSFADTEVIVHLYEEEGPDCVRRLNGMFAFAICDLRESRPRLFMARDHFGIKPFYYVFRNGGLAFASEAKALLEVPGIEAKIDLQALDRYLTFLWVPDPKTLFEGIFKLPPGHSATYRAGEFRISEYWVAVGAVGMELERRLYYEKELDFRVSRSYGPGRYDSDFEQKGIDYPIGHVRWTETRNMEAFVQLLAEGKLNLNPLITHCYPIENAASAYELITGKIGEPYLGILIEYPQERRVDSRRVNLGARQSSISEVEPVRVGLLGAGNFARGVLIPAMRQAGTELVGLCASNGIRAQSAAKKFGFAYCTTDEEQIFSDDSINSIAIATRHNLHALQVVRALESGKHVFCEKPLCLTEAELQAIRDAYSRASGCHLMVGFNRRFAPMALRTKAFLSKAVGPFTMHYRVNAGLLPRDHWVNDPEEGGGRILGEMCHFVDMLAFLCGSEPLSVQAQGCSAGGGQDVTATLEFANGSIGTIMYVGSGDRAFSKERLEVFGSGCIVALDDFRRLDLVRDGKRETFHCRLRQDKGHRAEWCAFSECIRSGSPAPIAFEEIVASTLATIRIADSLRSGRKERVISSERAAIPVPLVS